MFSMKFENYSHLTKNNNIQSKRMSENAPLLANEPISKHWNSLVGLLQRPQSEVYIIIKIYYAMCFEMVHHFFLRHGI